ncbi:hypothetical protein VTI28DRAFT_5995 [Corynascus sepedonium]
MDNLAQLEADVEQLTAAVKRLINQCNATNSLDEGLATTNAPEDINKERARILATLGGIRTLIGRPVDFLQHLASQVQIIACLRWLAEYQILACIPPEVSVPIKDLADLTGVAEGQLTRVIRLTATTGFLRETKPCSVSHTPLSVQFTTDQSLLDAVVFMAESVAPAALRMASATQHFGATCSPNESAYGLATRDMRPFHIALQEHSKLSRQWSAYLCHAGGLQQEDALVEALSRLSWANLGDTCIVEVGAQSTSLARRLALKFPTLRLVVQISGSSTQDGTVSPDYLWPDRENPPGLEAETDKNLRDRISVGYRNAGMPQPITDAAVYILHPPAAPPRSPSVSVGMTIRSELQAHFGLLRSGKGVLLILTTRLLPDPGTTSDSEVEAVARTRDFNMLQLVGEGEMESTELLNIISTVADNTGKLVVCNELRSSSGLILALAVRHQEY